MPCIKCNNKWKWGAKGRYQFKTKAHCERGRKAIFANKPKRK